MKVSLVFAFSPAQMTRQLLIAMEQAAITSDVWQKVLFCCCCCLYMLASSVMFSYSLPVLLQSLTVWSQRDWMEADFTHVSDCSFMVT
jgi:hypothetical protein